MKDLKLYMFFSLLFVLAMASNALCESYSYGNIEWSDNKDAVIKKTVNGGEFKYYATGIMNESVMRDVIMESSYDKNDGLEEIGHYIYNKKGLDKITVIGFSPRDLHGTIRSLSLDGVFLYNQNNRMMLQKFNSINNVALIKDSMLRKYGKPTTSKDDGMFQEFVWDNGEKVVKLTTMRLGSAKVSYIDKAALAEAVSFLKEKYGDPEADSRRKAKETASKF